MSAEYIAENEASLLDELLSIREHFCRESKTCSSQSCPEGLAVLRICPGMTLDAWEILAERHGLNDWLTVPVNSDMTPHLNHVQNVLQKLSYKTEHDPLTGLSNRRVFERLLDQEIERSRRNKTPLSLAILDLDDFKKVNDTWGHLKGDEVLIDFAEMIAHTLRRYDLVARIGGEEFALILSGVGLFKAKQLVERLLDKAKALKFSTPDNSKSFSITCSAGIVCYKGIVNTDMRQLIDKADKALYKAKESGKDQVCTADIIDYESTTRETLVHANEKKFLFTGT
ncbi:GGDEF domain-containing protein [Maridesulfovibrio hydrothermalis]|uniref:diguanylate cyclase n=1 Tax=Maridesulfovibrio hydrothermalis AM13 = DSM 14728 TaxID=1121451 RepID=L0RFB8_9BACT|nr:GGDEF domain-containing protein [Maridesulfovibrio hydrothermalis]CCO24271.1 Diguanylate cyclase [Maridesulfovibrio hydrothermalis AM13 = DSM 14728]